MRRPALLVLTAVCALLVPAGLAGAAPAEDPSGPGVPGSAPAVPEGDRDGDRVSDDFEDDLRGAAAAERVRVIVTGMRPDRARRVVGAFRLKHDLPIVDGFAASMTAAQARALARNPGVRRVEEDGVVHALDDATDRDFGAALARSDTGLDGSGVGICVIDTGIDPAHEQIAPRAVTFKDYVNGRTVAYDDHGHGTHVASIAAGDGTGSAVAATYVGVAPGAALWGAKVLNSAGSGADSDVAAAVQWCNGQEGVDVLSLSLGSPGTDGTDAVSLAVDNAVAAGDVVVVAAGNSGDAPGTISAPGVAAGAVTVGAVSDHSAPEGTARRDDGIWLAAFSSRGPTVSGLTKPDIAAPGVTVTAADAGTTGGYVTYSGTSMAAPYVSGAVALALQAAPSTSPSQVKSALMSSARDVGRTGVDDEWGAGLVDVRAFVDTVSGATAVDTTAFPSWQRTSGTVPTGSFAEVPVEVPVDGLDVPLAAVVTLTSGQLSCDIYCQLGLTAGEWSPDLDVELRAPDGTVLATSQCTLSGVTCATGRQETVAVRPAVAGTYTLRVYAWPEGSGAGGGFDVDLFRGPLVGSTEPGTGEPTDPEPEPENQPPVADAGADQTVKASKKTGEGSFTLDGTGSYDQDAETGESLGYLWTDQVGATVGTTATVPLARRAGTHVFTLVVTDVDGADSPPDSVTVTVTEATGGGGNGGGNGGGKPKR